MLAEKAKGDIPDSVASQTKEQVSYFGPGKTTDCWNQNRHERKAMLFPRDLMTFRLSRDLSHLVSEDQISRDTDVSNPEISHLVSRNRTASRESLVGLGARDAPEYSSHHQSSCDSCGVLRPARG